MKDSKSFSKKLGFVSIGLCAACCLFPITGAMFGLGTLTMIAGFLEWAGIISMFAAIVFFTIFLFRSRKTPACDVDCACKEEKQERV